MNPKKYGTIVAEMIMGSGGLEDAAVVNLIKWRQLYATRFTLKIVLLHVKLTKSIYYVNLKTPYVSSAHLHFNNHISSQARPKAAFSVIGHAQYEFTQDHGMEKLETIAAT